MDIKLYDVFRNARPDSRNVWYQVIGKEPNLRKSFLYKVIELYGDEADIPEIGMDYWVTDQWFDSEKTFIQSCTGTLVDQMAKCGIPNNYKDYDASLRSTKPKKVDEDEFYGTGDDQVLGIGSPMFLPPGFDIGELGATVPGEIGLIDPCDFNPSSCRHEPGMTRLQGDDREFHTICKHCGEELD